MGDSSVYWPEKRKTLTGKDATPLTGKDATPLTPLKDQHETYNAALDKIRSQPKRFKVEAITSVPCFELWILLHFKITARPYQATGTRSICEQVIRDLRKHIPRYEKGMNNVFELTYSSVDKAITRTELRERQCNKNGTDNPSTKVHNLVKYLRNIKGN